jgi:D-alanyl-lipoteichoic acid acyltransferase DltB (MBOAT superfamily)
LLFTSPTFLFFFLPLCLGAYFAARTMKARNAVLLAASWFFYAWGEPLYVVLMLGMTFLNYGSALAIDVREGRARKAALIGAVTTNLAVLAVFKYASFVVHNLNAALAPLALLVPDLGVPLPLGISFFTFHALSYLIDVYRRRFAANRKLAEVALYIAFFPQLIAGPIVRYKTIAQRLRLRRHSLGRASAGLRIFIIGLAQKLLIADAFAPLANALFDHAQRPGLIEAWLGVTAFALQIYFDFAGYSNMAIGLGLVLGFSLPRNFRTPYSSLSITEFWRRWHISLSTWFRDYLYIPLGGSRGPAWKTWRNLITVFLLCGLWHGASWTFVLWGAWHGAFLILERAGLGRLLRSVPRPLAWTYAILAVWGGWVLFRSPDLAHAAGIWSGMVGLHGLGGMAPETAFAFSREIRWLLPAAAILAVLRLNKAAGRLRWRVAPVWADNAAMASLIGLSLLQVAAGTYSPFLYFRF